MKELVLFAILALATTPVRAEGWETRTDHFIVYSQSKAKEAEEFARKPERYTLAMRSVQQLSDKVRSDSQRLTVYRTGNITDIAILYGSAAAPVAGFYVPQAGGSVAFVPAQARIGEKTGGRGQLDPQTVLLHEYAHHFMY